MRYRSFSDSDDIAADVNAFVKFLDAADYRRQLRNIGDGLNKKGYVTYTDDLRFSLELQLLNVELLRMQNSGRILGTDDHSHEAIDFITGIAQALPHLSTKARKELRGKIIGGLKTNGLRPLQHEFRVAGMIGRN